LRGAETHDFAISGTFESFYGIFDGSDHGSLMDSGFTCSEYRQRRMVAGLETYPGFPNSLLQVTMSASHSFKPTASTAV
jgi:hypothetical protein